MQWTISLLRQILPDAEFHGFDNDHVFDLFNVAYLKQFESIQSKNVLYFIVYEDEPHLEGWYNNSFDRTANIAVLKENTAISFILDGRVSLATRSDLRHIFVNNIWQAIHAFRTYVLLRSKAVVIGITGSVGKTTCAVMVEDLLQRKYWCKRIYSKRLTPLTLSSWVLNFLEEKDEVLIMEYSMYRSDHIRKLTELLYPNYAIFLNIEKMHLGVHGIETVDDIVSAKSALTRCARLSILNKDDNMVMKAKTKSLRTFSIGNISADAYVVIDTQESISIVIQGKLKVVFVPYIRTRLFLQQALAASLIAFELGVPSNDISSALQHFQPKENRIPWINIGTKKILFDGDVTISGRLKALSDTFYTKTLLIILEFDFGEENVKLQIDMFNSVFRTFSDVRILDTLSDVVSTYGFKDVSLVHQDTLLDNTENYDFIVVHFGTYFRRYTDMAMLQSFF